MSSATPEGPRPSLPMAARMGRRGFMAGLAATGGALCLTACGPAAPSRAGSLKAGPPPQVSPLLDEEKVGKAVGRLDGLVGDAMSRTGVPGVAVAVVYRGKVLYTKGFGVRKVGASGKVGPDTIFQLASLSKPLASTVVGGVVGRKVVEWDDPVVRYNPGFSLSGPYVTRNATFADLLSHRSGLRTGCGDLLEDLGFDQAYILSHLDQQPLDAFRSTYHYSNFGYTEGGLAAAAAMRTSWADLADRILFKPLGMMRSSYRFSDYQKATDRASIHVPAGGGTWVAKYTRDADAQAPAGGASSSVRDLSKWMLLQLAQGKYAGRQLIDPAALLMAHVPHIRTGPPPAPAGRVAFYGLGWNVSYDAEGRLQLGHSGAFELGASTNVAMLPGEQLGIVTLTNGKPQGVPEAIDNGFLDVAQHGAPTIDWLSFALKQFKAIEQAAKPDVDYSKRPAGATPPAADGTYIGTYANSHYGPLVVSEQGGKLVMTMGPATGPTTFPLAAYDGDTFSFPTIGENANGLSGAVFTVGPDGKASSVRLEYYDQTGLGTFRRS